MSFHRGGRRIGVVARALRVGQGVSRAGLRRRGGVAVRSAAGRGRQGGHVTPWWAALASGGGVLGERLNIASSSTAPPPYVGRKSRRRGQPVALRPASGKLRVNQHVVTR